MRRGEAHSSTRKMPWSYDYILDKTRIFLGGFKSHLEPDSAFVKVGEITGDRKTLCPHPDWIDASIFG